MFNDIMLGLYSFGLVIIPVIGYLAVKKNWRIVRWF